MNITNCIVAQLCQSRRIQRYAQPPQPIASQNSLRAKNRDGKWCYNPLGLLRYFIADSVFLVKMH
jgi:hypothetical protein